MDFVLNVFRGDHDEDIRQRMDAAIWLADSGFGKPTVDIALEPLEDRWFTIDIGDPPQSNGNPAIEL